MPYCEKALDQHFFRAYDIRGIVSSEFDENAFYTIGRAIALRLYELKRQEVFLGRDGRLTSNQMAEALKAGLIDSGIHVVDLGTITSPMMYFSTYQGMIDSGLIVTASHNPAAYNGIKIVLAGKTLTQPDIDLIYHLVQGQNFRSARGSSRYGNMLAAYEQRVLRDIELKRSLKVVVDCGNGVAGPIIPTLLKRLGCEVIPLYCEVDGRFPHHHPDPSLAENLQDLKKSVLAEQADIGLAFDGDADRLGVVTNTGKIIWPDRLMMFYLNDLLKRYQRPIIVFDVKCSALLGQMIEANNGVPVMCPTGHSIVKKVMEEQQAIFAGEMSGHLFFRDRWYGFDDALYSACRLLELISLDTASTDEQFARIADPINTPEIKIPIAEDRKFQFMHRFLALASFPHAKLNRIDGLRVEFDDGWGLLRASNTTANLIARFEADSLQVLDRIKQDFIKEIQKVDPLLSVDF